MIILQRLDTDRITAAVDALGTPLSRPAINSTNRHHVRAVLAGIGFPSHSFNAAPLADLQAAYYSLATDGLGLVQCLYDTDQTIDVETVLENLKEAANRYAAANIGLVFNLPTEALAYAALQAAKATELPLAPKPAKAAPALALAPAATTDAIQNAAQAIAALLTMQQQPQAAPLDEARIIQLIKENAAATVVRIETATTTREIKTGLHHHTLPKLIKTLSALRPSMRNVFLVGQAGSGKTTLAEQAAEALGLDFYFNGAIDSEYKLTGFIDASGRYNSTAFRKAYEQGGLYLFDEIDSSSAGALLALNAALANGHMDFADGSIKRHADFYCIAAGNTYGNGADRVYCGRNQLDGATLDRFIFMPIGYDEKLERTLANNDSWVDYVQSLRRAADRLKIRHIISPRASISGACLLAAGDDRAEVEAKTIWKGLDSDTINKIKGAA